MTKREIFLLATLFAVIVMVVLGRDVFSSFAASVIAPSYNPYAMVLNSAGLYETSADDKVQSTRDLKTYRDSDAGFEFQYVAQILSPFDARETVPPDNKTFHSSVKLISAARASEIGKNNCRYGASGIVSVCDVQHEGGISFVVLAKSLKATIKQLPVQKSTVSIFGAPALVYRIGAEGDGSDYYFASLSQGQTLVVVRHFRVSFAPSDELLSRVVATLKLAK